ncbi:putative aldo-keto reductase [Clohesyomyces aquaticus]|uniref:Putative aldo-keto reductase n=1 Tax=Clohesyomyces aquaticus TaxID=1231657 RepID=A0A1Y1Y7B5_9PLEO|nr:putative aldo-keto reductase [Clohesyomyces aquaticus]
MPQGTIELASGHEMPLVGFGLWKVPKESAADTVYNAIRAGYRLFDGAYDYQNEKEAGQGIQRAIKEGLVKREDIFVTTKLWNNYHSKEHALPMMKAQTEAWGLGYTDLFLIHFPCPLEYISPEKRRYPGWWMDDAGTIKPAKVSMRETWEQMEAHVDQKNRKTLYDINTYARHPISNLQIEHHPYLVQPNLISMAQEHDIAVTAYSSFGPQSFLELPEDFRNRAEKVELLFDAEPVKSIAGKHGKTQAQVLLRWATQRNIAVVPKSNSQSRLAQNLDLDSISKMDKGLRFNDPGYYLPKHPLHLFA